MQIITPIKAPDFKRFKAQYDQIDGRADIVEIWLDRVEDVDGFLGAFKTFLETPSDSPLSEGERPQFLGVCKTVEEGGDFTEGPEEKSRILDQFLKSGGTWVDFDLSRNPLPIILSFPGDKLWLSFHDFEGVNPDLFNILVGMQVLEPAVYKFSVTPQSEADLTSFLAFARTCHHNFNVVFTTMGPIGKEGREKLMDYTWGAFYALDEKSRTASGQPTLDDL